MPPQSRREPPQPLHRGREEGENQGHRGAQRQGLGEGDGDEAVPFGHGQGEHVQRAARVAGPPEHAHRRDEEGQQEDRVEQDVEHSRARLGAHRHQSDHQQEQPEHRRLPVQGDGRSGGGHGGW